MFVDFAQCVQLPESVALSSLVRFGCVDCLYNLLPNAPYHSISIGWVIRGGLCDRVIHAPIRRRAVASSQHELVGDMVKGFSEILKYVGGNGCQFVGHLINFSDIVDAMTGLCIVLDFDSVWVGIAEGVERKPEILDVLFGPCDFRLNTVDDFTHDR